MHMRVLQHLGILALGFSLTINKKTHKKVSHSRKTIPNEYIWPIIWD